MRVQRATNLHEADPGSREARSADDHQLGGKFAFPPAMNEHGHITFETSDMTKIQQRLQERGLKTDFALPGGLRGKPAGGCRVVDWNGQKAALICFVPADGNHGDLFVMDRAGLAALPENGAPQFAQAGPLMTVTRTKDNRVYLPTGGGDKKLPQKLLQMS